MITVADLPELVTREGYQGPRPILRCSACGVEFSADVGDYFSLTPDYEFKCCNEPMELVTREVRFIPWKKQESK